MNLNLAGDTIDAVSIDSLEADFAPSRTPSDAIPLTIIFELCRYRRHLSLIGIGKDAVVFNDNQDDSVLKIYCYKGDHREVVRAAAALGKQEFSDGNGYNPFAFSIWKLGLIGMELDHRMRNYFLPSSEEAGRILLAPLSEGYGAFNLGGLTLIVQKTSKNTSRVLDKSVWGDARRGLLALSKQGIFIDLESPTNFRGCSEKLFPITYLDLIFPTFSGEAPPTLESKISSLTLSGLRGKREIKEWLGKECIAN